MKENFEKILASDEKLLWAGRPESFDAMDKSNKPAFKNSCIKAVVIFAVLIGAYLWAAAAVSAEIMPGLIAFFVLIAAFKPISFFTDAAKLRKYVSYAVTDRRLIVCKDDVREMPLRLVNQARLMTDEDGHTSLVCGRKAIEGKQSAWRDASLFCQNLSEKDTADCESFVFYAVEDLEGLKAALEGVLKLS